MKAAKFNYKTLLIICQLINSILLQGCLQRFNNYGVLDITVNNTGTVTALIAENKAVTYSENGGFRRTTYHTTYWLKQYETASGKLIKKKELATPSAADKLSIACYGRFDNNIWLYNNGLVAVDINTLEEVTNEEKIAVSNGVDKNLFPVGDRLIKPMLEKGLIGFTSDNGEAYQLTVSDFKIHKIKELEKDDAAEEEQINRLFHDDNYGVRCDTFNNTLFVFAKNESDAKQNTPQQSDISEKAYRMKVFRGDYTIRQLGVHQIFNTGKILQLTAASYLNPCFTADTYSGKPIHLSNPAGFLVIHQDVLGEKSQAIISRISTDGKVIWEKPMGVSTKIVHCTLQGKYLFITTNKKYMLSPFIGKDALCIIDTSTGMLVTPLLNA